MLKVTTPASNKRLTTVAAVRGMFGFTSAQLNDAGVEALIDRASDIAASYCGRVFATEGLRQTEFPQTGLLSIPLVRFPVSSTGLTVTENGASLTIEDDFVLDEEVATLRRVCNGYRRDWCGSIVINYTAGYVLPDDDGERTLPHDVEQAALYLIGDLWQAISRQEGGTLKREKLDGVGEWEFFMPGATTKLSNPVAQILLDPYVRVTL